jgi:adenylosuccinate synthase
LLPDTRLTVSRSLASRVSSGADWVLAKTDSVADLDRLAQVEVEYVTLPGWKSDISNIHSFEELPANCQSYVKFIEDYLGVKVQFIGVGPSRSASITVF